MLIFFLQCIVTPCSECSTFATQSVKEHVVKFPSHAFPSQTSPTKGQSRFKSTAQSATSDHRHLGRRWIPRGQSWVTGLRAVARVTPSETSPAHD